MRTQQLPRVMNAFSNLLIVIATYNEIDSLPILVAKLLELLPDVSILVIDDSSPDGTGKWCDEFAKSNSKFQVIHRPAKSGLGSATLLGLQWAIEEGFEYAATMDADLSHDPNSLLPMYHLIDEPHFGGPDVVIGSRYVKGGQIMGWPWYRRLSSRLLNTYVRLVLRLRTNDNSGAFRIYKTEALKKINLRKVESTGYAYLEEILWRLQMAKFKMAEHPIVFNNRTKGKSKANLPEVIGSFIQIMKMSISKLRKKS